MVGHLLRRALRAFGIVLAATVLSFLLLRALPGDALVGSVERRTLSSAQREATRARLGLDRPVAAQLASYLGAVARLDLGLSVSERRPVATVLAEALPATATLSACALVLAAAIGIGVGTLHGWRPADRRVSIAASSLVMLYALPEVVVGIALLAVFGVVLGVLPVGGIADPLTAIVGSPVERAIDRARHLVLPASALALAWAASLARQQRATVSDIADEPFVRVARAKGASGARALWRHGMRPALPATVTLLGSMIQVLAGGTVIVESLFAWPGMGSLVVRAVAQRDAPLVAGAVIVIAAVVALGSLLTEAVVLALDPRLRAGERREDA